MFTLFIAFRDIVMICFGVMSLSQGMVSLVSLLINMSLMTCLCVHIWHFSLHDTTSISLTVFYVSLSFVWYICAEWGSISISRVNTINLVKVIDGKTLVKSNGNQSCSYSDMLLSYRGVCIIEKWELNPRYKTVFIMKVLSACYTLWK